MGQGLGLRPGDDGGAALHRAPARGGAPADRARGDERRGDGRLPGALPARPGDAALLDRDPAARVRPRAARAPHASGRDQRARRHGRRGAARARVLRRRRGLGPLHPAGLHALQAGRRRGPRQPGLEARRVGQARARRVGRQRGGGLRAHDRRDQPGRRVRQRAHGRHAALRRPPPRPREPRSAERAAAGDPRRRVLRAAQAAHGRHVRARTGVRHLRTGRGARRGRRAVSRPPGAHEAASAVDPVRPGDRHGGDAADADRRARGRLSRRLPRVLRGARGRGRRGGRPRRPDRARRGARARGRGHDHQGVEDLARPLPPRDRGDGRRGCARRVRLARRRWRASRSSTGRSSSTSSPRPRRRASCRAGSR